MQPITTFLWFDKEAEEAATYYVSVFPNSMVKNVQRYPEAAKAIGYAPGTVMTVDFELNGVPFTALNGGAQEGFKFSPATSFMVPCDSQAEIDQLWAALSAVPEAEACGWCTDKFGITWQVVPTILGQLMADPTKTDKVMAAFMPMKKLDIATLLEAANA